jgi:leader peptidase (prepilin peptidase)/N-methyltransferase
VLAVLLAASAAWQGDWWSLARAVIGAAALFAFFLAIVLIHPPGMGFGDVRLSGLIGGVLAYLSWSTVVIGAFAGFLLGSVIGLIMIAVRGGDRKVAVPFGPFMIGGALLAVFVAEPISQWYVDLVL